MLKAINISKRFGGITALSGVSLELHPGKVTAIIGENGAGKSTLMKIFAGEYNDYQGEVELNGKLIRFNNPREAEQAGIAIIHQELNLVPMMSVADNIFLGREICGPAGLLDKKAMREKVRQLLRQLQLDVDPDTIVSGLRVGEQQVVEIARALLANTSVIIMDEPTSALSDREVEVLFSIIRQLKQEGKTIVYISHKLAELNQIADSYVVLRDGATVGSGDLPDISSDELIAKMTGREISFSKSGKSIEGRPELLAVSNFGLRHPILKNRKLLDDISFTLQEGEIIGLYGLMGAGRTELVESIFGLHPSDSTGTISIRGVRTKIKSPDDAIKAGIALVPEDRKTQGLFLPRSIRFNAGVTILKQLQDWGLVLNAKREKKNADQFIQRLRIKASSDLAAAGTLSGGNQQKLVLAKWLATSPRILLLDEPTRGIDIHAKTEIYKLMKELAGQGMGIIMVSSELPEVLAVADRVLVMCEGTVTGALPIEKADEQTILKLAIQKLN